MIETILSRQTQVVALLISALFALISSHLLGVAFYFALAGFWYRNIQMTPERPLMPIEIALRGGMIAATAVTVATALTA